MKIDIASYLQQGPIYIENCNTCKWINLTEEEQRQRASQGLPVIHIPHICEKYNERVYHRMHGGEPEHGSFLWPCDDCVKDDYEHYIERRNYE